MGNSQDYQSIITPNSEYLTPDPVATLMTRCQCQAQQSTAHSDQWHGLCCLIVIQLHCPARPTISWHWFTPIFAVLNLTGEDNSHGANIFLPIYTSTIWIAPMQNCLPCMFYLQAACLRVRLSQIYFIFEWDDLLSIMV